MVKISLIRTYSSPIENVYTLAFHPNSKYFIAGGSRGIAIYHVDRSDPIKVLIDYPLPVYAVLFLENYILVTGVSGSIYIYNDVFVKVGELLCASQGSQARKTLPISNFDLSITPDKERFAVAGSQGLLSIYTLRDWKHELSITISKNNIRSLSYSINGDLLVAGMSGGNVHVLDGKTAELVRNIEGHGGSVFSVSFSRDGKMFSTGGKDARLRIWNVEDRKLVPRVKILAHAYAIKSICFLKNSSYLLSVSQDKTIKIWDTTKSECIYQVGLRDEGHRFVINKVRVSLDSKYCLTAGDDKQIKLWSIE